MSEYLYSASTNTFYSESLEDLYIAAGTWPPDIVAVDNATYQEYAANDTPEGKYRIAGDDGLPAWADILPPTHSELVMQADSLKAELMEVAEAKIKLLERVVKLGMATDAETSSLGAWEKYSVLLMRIKPEDAPDIDWPEVPEDVA
ncbi:tail fiber assembly protein [Kluyvera intermedia]|uniref:tail fiber assembly protein n=1 Tax=Kluyvera intermedia TaxID=61648 RepID=UPI003D0221A8